MFSFMNILMIRVRCRVMGAGYPWGWDGQFWGVTDGFSDGVFAGLGGVMFVLGRMLGGWYRLGGVIGIGGSGIVYFVDDFFLGCQVVVKVFYFLFVGDEVFVEWFRFEVRLVVLFVDLYVVVIYDWGVDGQVYLVIEYLGGGSFCSIFFLGWTLILFQMFMVAFEVCWAFDYVYWQGIVYWDVKLVNLLFG